MKNGPYFNPEVGEYEIWLDDQLVTWASSEPVANQLYNQARTTKYEHLRKSQSNTEQQTVVAWEWYTLEAPNKPQTIQALDKAIQNV